jgi:hypothetical protein
MIANPRALALLTKSIRRFEPKTVQSKTFLGFLDNFIFFGIYLSLRSLIGLVIIDVIVPF